MPEELRARLSSRKPAQRENDERDQVLQEIIDFIAAGDYIVTGNTRHFTKSHKNTKIITGRGLLELVAAGRQKE